MTQAAYLLVFAIVLSFSCVSLAEEAEIQVTSSSSTNSSDLIVGELIDVNAVKASQTASAVSFIISSMRGKRNILTANDIFSFSMTSNQLDKYYSDVIPRVIVFLIIIGFLVLGFLCYIPIWIIFSKKEVFCFDKAWRTGQYTKAQKIGPLIAMTILLALALVGLVFMITNSIVVTDGVVKAVDELTTPSDTLSSQSTQANNDVNGALQKSGDVVTDANIINGQANTLNSSAQTFSTTSLQTLISQLGIIKSSVQSLSVPQADIEGNLTAFITNLSNQQTAVNNYVTYSQTTTIGPQSQGVIPQMNITIKTLLSNSKDQLNKVPYKQLSTLSNQLKDLNLKSYNTTRSIVTIVLAVVMTIPFILAILGIILKKLHIVMAGGFIGVILITLVFLIGIFTFGYSLILGDGCQIAKDDQPSLISASPEFSRLSINCRNGKTLSEAYGLDFSSFLLNSNQTLLNFVTEGNTVSSHLTQLNARGLNITVLSALYYLYQTNATKLFDSFSYSISANPLTYKLPTNFTTLSTLANQTRDDLIAACTSGCGTYNGVSLTNVQVQNLDLDQISAGNKNLSTFAKEVNDKYVRYSNYPALALDVDTKITSFYPSGVTIGISVDSLTATANSFESRINTNVANTAQTRGNIIDFAHLGTCGYVPNAMDELYSNLCLYILPFSDVVAVGAFTLGIFAIPFLMISCFCVVHRWQKEEAGFESKSTGVEFLSWNNQS